MLKIFDILRAGSVKRWHIVETLREQRLAEHLFSVSVMAGEIARRMGLRPTHIHLVMIAAMFHDIDEVISGDPPTPTKERARNAGFEMNDLFKEYKIIDTKLMAQVIPDIERIIKCADHLDTVFFLRENRVGRHAQQVYVERTSAATGYFEKSGVPGKVAMDIYHESSMVKYII